MFVNYKCNLSYYNKNTYTRNKPEEGRVFHYPFSHLVSVAINSFEILPLMWILVTGGRTDGWMWQQNLVAWQIIINYHMKCLDRWMDGGMDGKSNNIENHVICMTPNDTLRTLSIHELHRPLCSILSKIILFWIRSPLIGRNC